MHSQAQSVGTQFDAQLTSVDPGKTIKGTFNGGSDYKKVNSGVFNFTADDGGNGIDFFAFCVEASKTTNQNETYTYEIRNNSELANFDKVAKLVGGFLDTNANQNDGEAAAFQWAIWEITDEAAGNTNLDLDADMVRISDQNSATRTRGNEILANIDNYDAADLVYLTNDESQNVVAWKATSVPEPASLELLFLSGVFLLRRKRS